MPKLKRDIDIGGRKYRLEASTDYDSWQFVLENDFSERVQSSASLVETQPGQYSVLLDGRSLHVRMEAGQGTAVVHVGGSEYPVAVQDPREAKRNSSAAAAEGREAVMAPMPGKVIRILVVEGQEVLAGAGILVIEAMKMQNELKCHRAGRIKSVHATEGSTVASGEVLAIVE
jgi:biotin carboxyl carrier protein